MPWPPPPYPIKDDTPAAKLYTLLPGAQQARREIEREIEGEIASFREAVGELSAMRESVGRSFALQVLAETLFDEVVPWRRLFRKFLLRSTGIDPLLQRQVRRPRISASVSSVLDALASWALFNHVYEQMIAGGARAEQSGGSRDEQVIAAIEAGLRVLERHHVASAMALNAAMPMPKEVADEYRLGKTERMSAWAAARLSRRNQSLTRALAEHDSSRLAALAAELPPAVLLAWGDRSPAESPQDLLNRIASEIESTALWQDHERESSLDSEPRELAAESSSLDDFAMREDAQLPTLRERANLTPREREVIDLTLDGMNQDSIAAALGIKVGTVKSHKFRAKEKLRHAAPRAEKPGLASESSDLDDFAMREDAQLATPLKRANLTPRQRDVIDLSGRGMKQDSIAAALGIGVSTVKTHKSRAMEKLTGVEGIPNGSAVTI